MNRTGFIPHTISIQGPRNYGGIPTGNGQTSSEASMLHPISRTCNISSMPASQQQDFFLYHPYDGTLEALYVSSVPETDVTDFQINVVQKNGPLVEELSVPKEIGKLTVNGIEIAPSKRLGEGPVFIRIHSPSAAVNVLVTAHILTSQVRA